MKFLEESAMWSGPPGLQADAPVGLRFECAGRAGSGGTARTRASAPLQRQQTGEMPRRVGDRDGPLAATRVSTRHARVRAPQAAGNVPCHRGES
jgi:hypothetical protein